jgi:hypothetical protein
MIVVGLDPGDVNLDLNDIGIDAVLCGAEVL